MRTLPCVLLAGLLACDSSPSTPLDSGPLPDGATPPGVDGGVPAGDAGLLPQPEATGVFPDHPRTLPFTYERPDVGEPIPAAELTRMTDVYLDLLARTRYFDFVDERAHGWPESAGGFWYATWWSGTGVEKRGGNITYMHVDVGAENNGIPTPALLEGACYAYRLYEDPRDQHLVRRLMRGLSSWQLAMRRGPGDMERGITSRAAYPESVMDTDRNVFIDYDNNRPGVDGGASYFIRIPTNPFWGDLYVQAKRSKDDMGHLMRAVALVDACDGTFTEAGAQADLEQMRELYQEWAQRVERDGFHIATYDQDLNVTLPTGDLATYFLLAQIECQAEVAIRLLSRNDSLDARCDNGGLGMAERDPVPPISNSSMQILRSHHEAAAGMALVTGDTERARDLATGLARRMETTLTVLESGEMPDNVRPHDIFQLIIESAVLGVPLTSREVRFLHQQLEIAAAGYDPTRPEWHVHDASVPDGDYDISPIDPGIEIKNLGLLLGACVAPYTNPAGRPILDCARVRERGRPE